MIIADTIRELLRRKVSANEIGIICPYRAQARLISAKLLEYEDLEISTVDKFQGRQKDCIMISFTRSNDGRMVNSPFNKRLVIY